MAVGFNFIFGWEKPNRFSQAFFRMKSLSKLFCRGQFILGKKYCMYGTLKIGGRVEINNSAAFITFIINIFIITTPRPSIPISLQPKRSRTQHSGVLWTRGWFWTMSWSTLAFNGTFNNGAKDTITCALREVSGMIQNAINFAFPLTTPSIAHAVYRATAVLLRALAAEWIDAFEPLYEILSLAGMTSEDARCVGARFDLN
jgi:hypothetical protein